MRNGILGTLLEIAKEFLNQSKNHMLDSEGNYISKIYLDSSDCIPSEVLKELIVLDDIEQSEDNLSRYIDMCYHMHIKGEELEVAKEVYKHLETIDLELREEMLDNGLLSNVEGLRATLVEESVINVSVKKEEIYKFTELELIYGFKNNSELFFGGNLTIWAKETDSKQNNSIITTLLESQGYSFDDLLYEISMYTDRNYYYSSTFLRTLIDSCRLLNGMGKPFFSRKISISDFLNDKETHTNNNDFKLLISDYSQDKIYWNNSVIALEKGINLEQLEVVRIK